MSHHTLRLRFQAIAIAVLTCLTLTTAQAQMKGDFDAADANRDGHVTFEEFAAYAKQELADASGRKARRFRQLSDEQQTKLLHKRFDKADRNHKGYLDRSDWTAPRT